VTTLYVVMVNDRHFDPEPYLFSTEAGALGFARERARDWLAESAPPEGWLFYADHPTEEDAVWVLVKTVDDPAEVPA
jgi:hypothetical protein